MLCKKIKDFENYLITDNGFVYSLKRNMYLKPFLIRNKYWAVTIQDDIGNARFYIHTLVANHYLENPDERKRVKHIDGNTLNNNVENLKWMDKTYLTKFN